MTICNRCPKTDLLIADPQNIVVGTLTPDTLYKVYFENTATERVVVVTNTTNGDGLLTVDVSGEGIMNDHDYNVWCTLATEGYKDLKPITISDDVVNCLSVRFETVYEGDEKLSIETQTIELYD